MDTYGDDDIYEVLDLDSLGAAVQLLLPTEQDVGLDDAPVSATSTDNASSAAAVPTAATNSGSSRSTAKTPKKSVSASVISGIGRPGAVKPIELKTSVSLSSTPSRAVSSATTPLSVVTPDSKATAEDKLSKSARGTPHRGGNGAAAAKNGPSPPITSAPSDPEPVTSSNNGNSCSNNTSTSTTAASKPPGSTTSSTSTPSPTVSEKAAFDRKMSPQTQRTPPPPSARTPPVKERSAGSTPSSVSSGTTAVPSGIVTAAAVGATVGSGTTPTAALSGAGLGGVGGGVGLSSLQGSGLLPPLGKALELEEEPVLTEEQRQIMRMIDESFHFIPEGVDSEKANRYVPRNLYPTPASFPTTPLPVFENGAVFEKLDVDTLFFIFYYQQGSYQQYLAARELKRRTWGYHKKYKTWFKRHEEPQVTGEDYEQGTFVYFDYETGWCQRIKTEFTFEYSYLEDELL